MLTEQNIYLCFDQNLKRYKSPSGKIFFCNKTLKLLSSKEIAHYVIKVVKTTPKTTLSNVSF